MLPHNRILKTKTRPARGSHLPVLMKLLSLTTGPVLEVGCGMYSTCYLHWACYVNKRPLVTYETNSDYFDFLRQFESDFHTIHCITNYDEVDWSPAWSVAFIDHVPNERRHLDIKKVTHAKYIAAHDADNTDMKNYHYDKLYRTFRYRAKYHKAHPATAIFSNYHDLSDLII